MKLRLLFITVLLILGSSAYALVDFASWPGNASWWGNGTDRLGAATASGDFNGDGIWDLAISAPNATSRAGEVYVFLGNASFLDSMMYIDPANSADVVIQGNPSMQLGRAMVMGDVNGDAIEDLIIGAPRSTEGGQVWVIFGSTSPSDFITVPDVAIIGVAQEDGCGSAVATSLISFENGQQDNIQDIIIGSPGADPLLRNNAGRVDVIYGRQSGWPATINLATEAADKTIFGPTTAARFGFAICKAPSFQGELYGNNINNDDVGDLIASAPGQEYLGRLQSGAIHMFYSDEGLTADTVDLLTADQLPGYRYIGGANSFDQTGRSLISFNSGNDRFLFVGAPAALLPPNQRKGAIYQISWDQLSVPSVYVDLRNTTRYQARYLGNQEGDSLGVVLSGIEGLFLFSVPGRGYLDRNRGGIVFSYHGDIDLQGDVYPDTMGMNLRRYYGPAGGDQFGRILSIGDYNGDGIGDWVTGSQETDDSGGREVAISGGLPHALTFRPLPGQTSVSIDDTVRIRVTDFEEGINPDDFYISVDGIEYLPASPYVSYSSVDEVYTFVVTPENPFDIDVPIQVDAQFTDLGGYHSPFYSYQFVTGTDDQAPIVTDMDPEPDEVGVAVTRNVAFSLTDIGAGVDIESIQVRVEGVDAVYGDDILDVSGTPDNYRVEFNPPELLPNDEIIDVTIWASDLAVPANIMTPFGYTFRTSLDTIPPVIDGIFPAPGATIDVRTPLFFEIYDMNAGVAVDSTHMILTTTSGTFDADIASYAVTDGYRYEYTPSSPFPSGNLAVQIQAMDLANPANVMNDTLYTYTVVEDTIAPHLAREYPRADTIDVARTTPIILEIVDNAAGVDSSSITLEIDNQNITLNQLIFEPLTHLGYRLTYNRSIGVYGAEVEVHLTARDQTNSGYLLDTTYTFQTITDTLGPAFVVISPDTVSTEPPRILSVQDSLFWEVRDDLAGVDPQSVFFSLDGEVLTDEIQIRSPFEVADAEYRLLYVNSEPFAYEDTLRVQIGINDREEPSNNTTMIYEVYTEPDEDAPFLSNLDPFPGRTRVARNSDIEFQVLDNGLGVELDSIHLIVDGELIPHNSISYTPVDQGYHVAYNPPNLFGHQDTIDVRVRAHDLSFEANLMDSTWYFITLSDDHEPPVITDMSPPDQTENLNLDFQIQFDLVDVGTGVDTINTAITRENSPWTVEITKEEIENGYTYFINPLIDYKYSDEITIAINTQDLAEDPNQPLLPYSYTWYVERDDDAPVFSEIFPPADSSATSNRWLEFNIADLKAGVDTSSVSFRIQNNEVKQNAIVTAVPEGYHYRYRPDGGWTQGETINVIIYAEDNSVGHNSNEINYTFDIVDDQVPPIVLEESISPAPGDTTVAVDDTLRLTLFDAGLGVDKRYVDLNVFGRPFGDFAEPTVIDDDSLGWNFTLPMEDLNLFPGQWVEVRIGAVDKADPPNYMDEYRYRFRVTADEDKELTVVPTTITPNGDGIWDEALIYHKGGTDTEVEIFDMRGRSVAKVTGNPASWNGLDDNGKPVPGGLYIFQLEAAGKVQQGTIAVAW